MIESDEDKIKFEILYKKYKYLMYDMANKVLHDKYLAEDTVHDTFVKITKKMSDIGDVDAKKTKNFIMVVTKNTALDAYRKRAKSMMQEISVDENEDSDLFISNENKDLSDLVCKDNTILDIVRDLPDKYKEVFLLKYVNNYNNKEISEILNISEDAVRQRILRGRNIIEKKLEGIQ